MTESPTATTAIDTQIAALLVTTDGVVQDITLDRTAPMGILTGMYAAIGCELVELVSLTGTLSAWMDEEGGYRAEPNIPVTLYLSDVHGLSRQIYFGAAIFTGGADEDGETLAISPADAAEIRRIITA